VTKFAFPALVFLVFALFYTSVTNPPPPDEPELAEPPAPVTQTVPSSQAVPATPKLPDVAETRPARESRPAEAVDGVRTELKTLSDELKRLSEESKANSDKIAQAATLRSDLQDSKSSNDKTAQTMVEQVDALRSDQTRFMQAAKEANDRTVQELRQEITSSQGRLAAQFGETIKANTARSEALSQRVDAMRKDLDEVKKTFADERQNESNISPGLALVVALAALVLGPFVARQVTANQIAAARKRDEAERSAAARSERVTANEPPLAPSVAPAPQQEAPHHQSPLSTGEATEVNEADAGRHAPSDPEKV